jgi:hypothetical protein
MEKVSMTNDAYDRVINRSLIYKEANKRIDFHEEKRRAFYDIEERRRQGHSEIKKLCVRGSFLRKRLFLPVKAYKNPVAGCVKEANDL